MHPHPHQPAALDPETFLPASAWSEQTGDDVPPDPEKFQEQPENGKTQKHMRRSTKAESPARLFGFADPEEIKASIKESVIESGKPYNVFDFYYTEGLAQWLAKHHLFEKVTLSVISLNAIYIAVDTDWNKDRPLESAASNDLQSSGVFFQISEHSFCAYFTLEWLIRFAAFKSKANCFCDAWFIFDTFMVVLMVCETWVLLIAGEALGWQGSNPLGNTAALRLFRLLRLARLLRMLRSLPELMILIKGMVTAMTSVFYVMGLLVIITYIFAIAFTQLAVGTPTIGEEYFGNVALSMYSLLIHATFMDDLAAFTNALRLEMWPLLALALAFISLASLTLMNMLVGILCEVVTSVAATEREEGLAVRMVERMQQVLDELDSDEDQIISYKEFSSMLEKPEALRCFRELGVNPMHCLDLADMFFFEDGEALELTFPEFMDIVMNLRESNQATVKDLYTLSQQLSKARKKDVDNFDRQMTAVRKTVEDTAANLERKVSDRCEQLALQMSTLLEEVRRIGSSPSSNAFSEVISPYSTAPAYSAATYTTTVVTGTGVKTKKSTPAVFRLVSRGNDPRSRSQPASRDHSKNDNR